MEEATTYEEVNIVINNVAWKVPREVADRITQLEAENKQLKELIETLQEQAIYHFEPSDVSDA